MARGVDIAAVAASHVAASHRTKQQNYDPETLDSIESFNNRVHLHQHGHSGQVSDVENVTNSPTSTFFPGTQRIASRTPERYLTRVVEETDVSGDVEGASISSESELEQELEEQGLYLGSYSRILALYSLAPLTSIIFFILFALVPRILHCKEGKYPYAPYLPFPVAELLIAGSAWSVIYSLNDFIFRVSVWLCTTTYTLIFRLKFPARRDPPPLGAAMPILLSGMAYSTLSVLLRLLTILILQIPHESGPSPTWREPVFRRVWWAGLGWALFEAITGIKQGYYGISLYRDVLVDPANLGDLENLASRHEETVPPRVFPRNYGATSPIGEAETTPTLSNPHPGQVIPTNGSSSTVADIARGRSSHADSERQPLLFPHSQSRESMPEFSALNLSIEAEVERDLDQLVKMRERDDLESIYGIPFIRIPSFISCLQRINSILLSMGYTLVLSAVYIISIPPPSNYLSLVIPLGILLQFSFYVLHSEIALPRLGVHTVVYVGLLVSLGLFFCGLGLWDAVS